MTVNLYWAQVVSHYMSRFKGEAQHPTSDHGDRCTPPLQITTNCRLKNGVNLPAIPVLQVKQLRALPRRLDVGDQLGHHERLEHLPDQPGFPSELLGCDREGCAAMPGAVR